MPVNRPNLSVLGSLALNVNAAIACGHGADISYDEMSAVVDRRAALELLDSTVQNGVCWDSYKSAELDEVLAFVAPGNAPKDVGTQSSGLHWLLALLIEAMQQRFWVSA